MSEITTEIRDLQEVVCVTCSLTARCCEAFIDSGPDRGTRMVMYDCHFAPGYPEHATRLTSIETYIDSLHDLIAEFSSLTQAARLLTYGYIAGFDLNQVPGTACLDWFQVVPNVTVRAFGLNETFELAAVSLSSLTDAAAILALISPEAELSCQRLKVIYDNNIANGRF